MDEQTYYQASKDLPVHDVNVIKRSIKTWRATAIGTLVIILIQCGFIGYLLKTQKEYVYVAEVRAGEGVEKLTPLGGKLIADQHIKLAFIQNYINRLMSLSLDPVVVKNNWLDNYKMSGINAQKEMTQFIQAQQLSSKIGNETQVISVRTFNAISDNSFQFTWDVTNYDQDGKKIQIIAWSGVFTVSENKTESYGIKQLLNPFGLQIESFSLNQLGR